MRGAYTLLSGKKVMNQNIEGKQGNKKSSHEGSLLTVKENKRDKPGHRKKVKE